LFPHIGKKLPKPGNWMENIKQFLAFPLFATSAWLLWVLSVQTGSDGVAAVLAGMLLLALALWFWERSRQGPGYWPWVGGVVAFVLLGVGLMLAAVPGGSGVRAQAEPTGALPAQEFTRERLAAARSAGRPVFVNMTAAWCITCLVNERVALSSRALARVFSDGGVLYLKGDWTNRDPAITGYLESFGRSGVPIYVYYPVGGEPRVLPQVLTESIVLNALRAGAGDAKAF
jgi:thiol:disulfide interchange protein DsbD